MREDEFFLDPSRLTMACGLAGYDRTQFKMELADKWDIQRNKTSRYGVVAVERQQHPQEPSAYLIQTLGRIAEVTEERLASASESERAAFRRRIRSLVEDVPTCPTSAISTTRSATPPERHARGRMRGRSSWPTAARTASLSLNGEDIDHRCGRDRNWCPRIS